MAVSPSWKMLPTGGVALAILNDAAVDGKVSRTCACVIGISIAPVPRRGWPKANTRLWSMWVSVPIPTTLMSPVASAAPIGIPGASGRGTPGARRGARQLHHVGDRRDAGDRLFRERAESIGERADQLAADVDRAAAHARDDARVLHLLAVQPGDDHVLLGSDGVLQDT